MHGPDTDELHERIAWRNNWLNLSTLNLTSIPPLYDGLLDFRCVNTQLTHLSELPRGLQQLHCRDNPHLIELPELPEGLQLLQCSNTALTHLPALPESLKVLYCYNTPLVDLPTLPEGLEILYCSNTPLTHLPELPRLRSLVCDNCPNLVIQRLRNESISDYKARWKVWREEEKSRLRIQERNEIFKEDMIAEFWKPERVEKMLETGGWNLIDSY